MIQTEPYVFKDGRIGTNTYSDKFYKNVKRLDENGETVIETVYYYIRKKGTEELYARTGEKKDQAIDILPFEYEEVTEEEMKELVPESEG